MKRPKNIGGYIAVAVFISLALAMAYKGYQLHHNYAITTGTITRITKPGWHNSGDYSVLYEYKIDGKVYSANNDYSYCNGQSMAQLSTLLTGKRFPVAYAVKSPSGGFMLLSQKYADKFRYTLPDSVLHYDSLLNCR